MSDELCGLREKWALLPCHYSFIFSSISGDLHEPSSWCCRRRCVCVPTPHDIWNEQRLFAVIFTGALSHWSTNWDEICRFSEIFISILSKISPHFSNEYRSQNIIISIKVLMTLTTVPIRLVFTSGSSSYLLWHSYLAFGLDRSSK